MIAVKEDFTNRITEIELYFTFMRKIESMDFDALDSLKISSDLIKIFRANSFLILYNLVESCIKNSIESIYENIDSNNISFDDLRKEIKIEIIKFLKLNINADTFVESINDISKDIILNCFNADSLLRGNFDARSIKKVSKNYGFSSSIQAKVLEDGTKQSINIENLLKVKKNRNDLAHGIFSFKECGRSYSSQDLIEIKDDVIEYLSQILSHIENFIQNQKYLKVNVI